MAGQARPLAASRGGPGARWWAETPFCAYDSAVTGQGEIPRLSIVIVSWESGPDLLECVRSLAVACEAGRHQRSVELVVVDNASDEFEPASVRSLWPGAQVQVNESNRGFGPAANQGVALARGGVVLLLNPDTRSVDDPFTPLLGAFADHPEAVAVAPRLLESGPGGHEPQEMFQLRRLPSWPQALRELLLLDKAFPRSRALIQERYSDRAREQPFEVEQPAAAALAVRREAFTRVGGFDEAFVPAWFEDVDLCARLLPLGKILYWPASRFVHGGGVAARTLGYDAFLPIYYRNAHRYWRKHRGGAAAAGYRLLVAVGMALRLLVLPLRPAPPRPRAEAARAYLRVLRWAAGLGGRLPEIGQ